MLPFTHDQFLAVFAAYNEAAWPAPVVAYLVAAAVLLAIARRWPAAGGLAVGALALLWAWTGLAYHGLFFAAVNPAARLFAGAFVLQAVLLAAWGWRRPPELSFGGGLQRGVGLALLVYATVLYPLLGLALGLRYPAMPTFGITPCPLTLFTFGLFLLARRPVPWWVLVIPLLWSLVGGSAAFLLQVPQDWVLLFSGVLTAGLGIAAARRVGHRAA
ncbi:MAG: hypothetical protein KF788_09050 [Piscinibacter sp.]|nr:hypothetical protein [Piscinibacter sp.]